MKILLIILLLIIGCAVRPLGDISIISTKELNMEANYINVYSNFEGKSVQHIVIFFPTGLSPTIEEAVDNALQKTEGDYMRNSSITISSWYIPYIYGQNIISIKGDVWKKINYNVNENQNLVPTSKTDNSNSSLIRFNPETGQEIISDSLKLKNNRDGS